jgi:AraC-like DNA-binding protein
MHSSTLPSSEPHHPRLAPILGQHALFSAEAVGLLDDLRRTMEQNPQGAHAAVARLMTLLTPPAEPTPAGKSGGLAPWQKRKIDRYLRDHLQHPLRVEDLAKLVSLSCSHFCRVFRQSFGTPPHAYIIHLRLELSRRLMLTTDASLSDIALACGMADQAHFSKLFRRAVGETPGAWRQRRLTDTQAEVRSARLKAGRSDRRFGR